ncbi:MAG: hypothetical protein ABIJ86_00590 [Spirochaetota bacterium]
MTVLRRTISFAFILMLGSLAFAQSNQVIDALLAQKTAASAETAYLLLVGGDWVDEDVTTSEAFELTLRKGWLPKKTTPESTLDLATFSLLAMRSLEVRGGVGWTLFHSKRYAYRELVALGIANASGGPSRIISGEEAVRMAGMLAGNDRRRK